jgi:hypothetical protein
MVDFSELHSPGGAWLQAFLSLVEPGGQFVKQRLPSGYVKIAIENGHRNSGFSH